MRRAFLAIALLFAPLPAAAESTVTWDFAAEGLSAWDQTQSAFVAQPAEQGLRVYASADSAIKRRTPEGGGVLAVTLEASAPRETPALLLWHVRGTQEGELVQLPFFVPASATATGTTLDVRQFPQWDPGTDVIGIAFPAGSDVTLKALHLHSYSLLDRVIEGAKTFWAYDEFQLHTINFVWGPLLASTPAAREQLYAKLPPAAASGNWIFYACIAAALVWGVFRALRSGDRRRAALTVALVCAACWVLYDVRMTAELAHYARTDLGEYAATGTGRTLRKTQNFFPVVDRLRALLREDERYVIIAPPAFPAHSFFRYHAFPALPVAAGTPGVGTWLVFHRGDVTVDAGNRLVSADGTVLAAGGSVVERFDPESFLYRIAP